MMDDLAEVKRSIAGVMAEETRTKRLVDENQAVDHSIYHYRRVEWSIIVLIYLGALLLYFKNIFTSDMKRANS